MINHTSTLIYSNLFDFLALSTPGVILCRSTVRNPYLRGVAKHCGSRVDTLTRWGAKEIGERLHEREKKDARTREREQRAGRWGWYQSVYLMRCTNRAAGRRIRGRDPCHASV